ncbi:unnamed protein product [Allacma fusca]|uniref:Uncharacterized protein n=1 Tax=Allacma fusca TaxID=39272 RepID=A0A8J2LKB3_9HEXA|nr:unnamed protein product [Allacma fusca]
MACSLKLHSCVVLAACLALINGSHGIVASEVEKHLDKVGTRVGKNEYISVFKEPPGEDGKKSKTFVLLSKLYLLGPNSSGDLNEVVNYPGGPLKLRRQYIIPSVYPPAQHHNEKILFPKEDTTTRKPSQYNVYNKKNFPSADRFPERKYTIGGEANQQGEQIQGVPLPLLRYLTQLEDGDTSLSPVVDDSGDGQNIGEGKDGETLGYYTLITVPRSKKASDGCPTGHLKDHRGVCREVFTFGGNVPRSS